MVKDDISHSLKAVKHCFGNHKGTFELVGYDFMIVPTSPTMGGTSNTDCPFEVRLIEVNTNPCLEESNTLLKSYIPRMLDDMLKIELDPVFGCIPAPGSSFPVDGYADSYNMWEWLMNLV